jgi:hypothetical protein
VRWVIRLASLLALACAAVIGWKRRGVAVARAWTFSLAERQARRARPYPTPEEREEEERWVQTVGLAAAHRATVVAPNAFTAGVMGRVAAQPPRNVMTAAPQTDASRLAGLRVAALTLALSALIAIVSGCVLTLVAPAAGLVALGMLVSGAVALLDLTERLVVLAGGAVTNDGLILGLAVIPGAVLLMRSVHSRLASGSPREA